MSYSVWRRVWVHKDHRVAALKFCEDRLQSSVSQIHAPGVSEENNTIKSENVECVRQIFKRGVDIRQRETSETCESIRSGVNEFGGEFVASPRQRPGLLAIAKVHSRR